MTLNIKEITELAKQEIAEEDFRKAVDEKKIQLREKRSIWGRLFPYKLTITRNKNGN